VISGLVCALAYWSILVVGKATDTVWAQLRLREVCSPFSTEPAPGDKSRSVKFLKGHFHQNARKVCQHFGLKGQ
jgi:hypothetical protein